MFDIIDFKIKKEKLKQLASKSVIFGATDEIHSDFVKALDLIKEDEEGLKSLDYLFESILEEKKLAQDKIKEVLE